MSRTPETFEVTLVVAAARNGVIGRAGDMPWRMPSSLRRFRSLTMGRPMVMGRKTYAAIGRALDGRDTIVVTRSATFAAKGVHAVHDMTQALALAARLAVARGVREIIIAGGGEIYVACLPYATRVHLDLIDASPEGDTVFPPLEATAWRVTEMATIPADPRDEHAATAIAYERIGPAQPLPAA